MTPYYDDGQVTLLLGDARECLRELPAESVNCVVTSPPYWSLRDYGVEPTVWGGEGGCEHEWGAPVEQQRGGTYSGKTRWQSSGQFCRVCGAWLGALGLEPTPEMFVAHMVEVFREVRRVLRGDGVLFLNIGDCYASAGGRVGVAPGGGKQGEAWRLRGLMTTPNRMPLDGLKPKDLVGIPWRLAFALRADGWYLRSDIIWAKPNPMPESVTDRPTKSHEYLFLLSKAARYYYDADAIREPAAPSSAARLSQVNLANQPGGAKSDGYADQFPGKRGRDRKPTEILQDMAAKRSKKISEDIAYEDTRNRRSVWHIPTAPFPEAHFATFPPALVEPCILAGCPEGGVVLDPFVGSGTTAMVARRLGRRAIGIDLNEEYLEMAVRRIGAQMALIGGEA